MKPFNQVSRGSLQATVKGPNCEEEEEEEELLTTSRSHRTRTRSIPLVTQQRHLQIKYRDFAYFI
ncbi:hypothetical protein EYF80_021651 [Liparis tanakae]|uniref:Uncharacterized protein n=1 Tax=Liparis tanakae TaxID=230148 RepID=A0A4Z2HQZ7_9TELE|nr:hypothetical protein EYF80_021651 [Liparis tanakae]